MRSKKRRIEIINELSRMSRGGWKNATSSDWKPLEDELAKYWRGSVSESVLNDYRNGNVVVVKAR